MAPPPPTPVLAQFLTHINTFVQTRNEAGLADYLPLEPPFGGQYVQMIAELRGAHAAATHPAEAEAALEEKVARALGAAREGADGSPWTTFVKFLVRYLAYLRDVSADPGRYLETYELLSELHQRANSALTHSALGYLVLPIVVTNARCVCRLAIGLDKQPGLIAHLRPGAGGGGSEDGGPRETLPERAANILRQAFVTCLNDRLSGLAADGRPEGKKRGIYTIANLCLKILFQCRKTRNATQIFENIYNLSPPLGAYPRRERVTYLYYLGRYLFQNSHFYRAQRVLQHAYDESPIRPDCVRQRRHILVYLLASNLTLGRFPSAALLRRPEAQGLADRFLPVCHAIRRGDLAAFRRHLALDGAPAAWFLHFRILLPLRNRGEVLVWRSLVRKTWILRGTRPAPDSRVAPQVDLHDLAAVFSYLNKRDPTDDSPDPDFAGLDDGDGDADAPDDPGSSASVRAIESKLSSLIDQGLLGGFLSHRRAKFAITGTKAKGGDILAAGFPRPWTVFADSASASDVEVPGWKQQTQQLRPGGWGGGAHIGPGSVITLSGARPVGA